MNSIPPRSTAAPAESDAGLDRALAAEAWALDPALVMLNHGSFGACPRPVLARQDALRRQMEAQPVRFLVDELPPLLDESRRALAGLIGGRPENLVFVSNATAGVNAVLRSLELRPGDELLLTDHAYNACANVVRYVARRAAARIVSVELPLPLRGPEQVVEAVLARVTARTRLALLDHVTSATGLVLPIAELVRGLRECEVDVLVDGAHAPGMLPLDVEGLGAAYYTGNCHKWLCAPKGAGFLYVRPDRQADLQPPVISHGFNQHRPDHTPFQDAFDWQGTADPTPWLCVGEAIGFLGGLLPGGLDALMHRNRQLAIAARRLLCARLPLEPVCPESMLGALAALQLPAIGQAPELDPAAVPPLLGLGSQFRRQYAIEVPVYYWSGARRALLRISAQAYNRLDDYVRLADVLQPLLNDRSPLPRAASGAMGEG